MEEYRYKRIFLLLFLIIFLVVIASMIWVSYKVKDDEVDRAIDNILTIFRGELEAQESNAQLLCVALSQNVELKDALLKVDEDRGDVILSNALRDLQTYTFVRDVKMQILTDDLFIFARSWDNSFVGFPLSSFREDLHRIKKLKKPKVSIDPGRLLSIKATTPIMEDSSIVGYIETIKTFDEITLNLRKYNIELLVLMKEKYLNIATLMRENATLKNFVIANKNFNISLLNDLKKVNLDYLAQDNYTFSDKYLYIFEVMYDGVGENIGYFVLAIQKSSLEYFVGKSDYISPFLQLSSKDLYGVVSNRGSYKDRYDKELISLLDISWEDNSPLIESEAREILDKYTKDELIDIILNKSYKEKKVGIIK